MICKMYIIIFIISLPRCKLLVVKLACRYLNEERLEIQVWVTYQPESADVRPRTRDKLIGSAFLDLETLADFRRKQHRIRFEPSRALQAGHVPIYLFLYFNN